MNKAAKTIDRMRANPRDWRIEQIQTVAKRYGKMGQVTVYLLPMTDARYQYQLTALLN